MFNLHPQLDKDCILIGQFKLCQLLLMNDANYPWFILVPARENISEIYQLSDEDQKQLLSESTFLSQKLMQVFSGDKMNIAALGNVVPQLHVHHVVRYKTDPTWPAPVWGKLAAIAYDELQLNEIMEKLQVLKGGGINFSEDQFKSS